MNTVREIDIFTKRTVSINKFAMRPVVVCNDGFSMSVQGGYGNYSHPKDSSEGIYKSMEIGFPSNDESLIYQYAECKNYTETVYAYVPINVIEAVILKHGGIDFDKTLQTNPNL